MRRNQRGGNVKIHTTLTHKQKGTQKDTLIMKKNHTEAVGLPLVEFERGRAQRSQRGEIEALEQCLAAHLRLECERS